MSLYNANYLTAQWSTSTFHFSTSYKLVSPATKRVAAGSIIVAITSHLILMVPLG